MIFKVLGAVIFAVAVMCTTPANAGADGADQGADGADDKGIGIYFDQDLLIPSVNEDRDYTMGVAIEIFWKDGPKSVKLLDDALGWINRKTPWAKVKSDSQRSLMIGSVNFTPDDLANRNPIFNDRPYASLLYLSSKRVITPNSEQNNGKHESRHNVMGTELQIGVLGLGIARSVQTSLHGYMRGLYNSDKPVDPMGWDHQISDGGELTLKYRVSYGERIKRGSYWDLAYTADGSIGYQSNASLGLQARLGRRKSGFWTLPFDPINRGNFLPSTARGELYLWAAYRVRGVLYDALLQGQFRHSDVTFGSSDINRLVHETGVGLTFDYKPIQLTFSHNYKSSELDGAASRSHHWGGILFIFRW